LTLWIILVSYYATSLNGKDLREKLNNFKTKQKMDRFKIFVTDYNWGDLEVEENAVRRLEKEKNIKIELISAQCRSEDEVIEKGCDADALLNQYAPITEKVISSLKKCKIIARYGTGVDNIDIKAATRHKIMVTNVPSYCDDEVAEHALSLILCCVRKIFLYNARAKSGIWDWRVGRPIKSLNELTLGLVGFGKTARRLAKKAKCLGFKVIAFTPRKHEKLYRKEGVERVEFDTLLKISDVISIHAPLTESTRHMFGKREFDLMKSTSFIVNTSRGKIIDEKALYDALINKKIQGAACDVLETEFPDKNHPLFKLENFIATPHVAFYSEKSLVRLREKPVIDIVRALTGDVPEGLLNRELIGQK